MSKLIVILGQTSTGKSDFAVQIAKTINGLNQSKGLIARTSQGEVLGEIISADSRQVYKGMNIGSGKITKKEMAGVPHYLIDVISPKKIFSVNDFQKQAFKKIKEISSRGNIPIICGGTGFYIDSIVNNQTFPEVPPNKKLRNELNKKNTEELFEMLKKIDKDRAENIDSRNKVRIVRAIEVVKALGKVPTKQELEKIGINKNNSDTFSARAENVSESISKKFKILKIGLAMPDEVLKEKIKSRLLARIKKGMIKEIENLHKKEKVSWKRLESFGLEYRYIALYLQKIKNLSPLKIRQAKNEMIEKLNTEIWHFAKRQKTWFKRDKEIIWINPLDKKEVQETTKIVNNFLLEN